jgi:hypothetical protein
VAPLDASCVVPGLLSQFLARQLTAMPLLLLLLLPQESDGMLLDAVYDPETTARRSTMYKLANRT